MLDLTTNPTRNSIRYVTVGYANDDVGLYPVATHLYAAYATAPPHPTDSRLDFPTCFCSHGSVTVGRSNASFRQTQWTGRVGGERITEFCRGRGFVPAVYSGYHFHT